MKSLICLLTLFATMAVAGPAVAQDETAEIDDIIEGLESNSDSTISLAMSRLRNKPKNAAKAIPALLDHLESENPRYVVEAAVVLVHIDPQQADKAVERILSFPKASGYASRFWYEHPEVSLEPLSKATMDPSLEKIALSGLQAVLQTVRSKPYAKTDDYKKQIELTTERVAKLFNDEDCSVDLRMMAATIYSQLAPEKAEQTLPVVLDSIATSSNYSYSGATILKPVIKEVTPTLLDEFNSHAWSSSAASRLAMILANNHRDIYDQLIAGAASPSPAVRHGCALTFGQSTMSNYRTDETIKALVPLLSDEHAEIRKTACRAIVSYYKSAIPQTIPVVFGLIEANEDVYSLPELLDILGDIGEPAAKHSPDAVIRLANDPELSIAHQPAAIAVMRVWPDKAEAVFPIVTKALEKANGYSSKTTDLVKAIRNLGQRAKPLEETLIERFEGLGNGNRRLPTQILIFRFEICKVLLLIDPDSEEHADRLLEIVESEPYASREAQAEAIWMVVERNDKREEVKAAFTSVMDSTSSFAHDLKVQAAAAMLKMFPDDKKQALEILEDSFNSRRSDVLNALNKIGADAQPLMAKVAGALSGGSTTDMVNALEILGEIGAPAKAHLKDIERLADSGSSSVKAAAAQALAKIGKTQ